MVDHGCWYGGRHFNGGAHVSASLGYDIELITISDWTAGSTAGANGLFLHSVHNFNLTTQTVHHCKSWLLKEFRENRF